MPRPRRPKRSSRFFELDGDVYLVSERDDEQLVAVRLTGRDRELVLRMIEENEIEMESRVLGGWE